VNTALIDLYWQIGEQISRRIAVNGWGQGTVEELAEYIRKRQPNARGFSAQNLWRMRQFHEAYRDQPKLSALLRELTWTHNLLILGKCKREEEREFYLRLACVQKWSSRELERQINSALFERVVLSPAKLSPPLAELHPDAAAIFKDAYLVEFLDLPPRHSEADLQRALVEQLKQFLIELGRDFCYVGSQYPIQVGGRDFALDLLFFDRALNCLIAFELKLVEFEPEHLGKLQFYLEALDRDVKKPHEQPSIGVLLCATKNHEVVEYALSRFLNGMTQAMHRLAEQTHPAFPVTVYYAFKQSETESDEGTASTGWETFLAAVNRAGFAINGTWPMRTEGDNRQIGIGSNALASSIVLVCRRRRSDAPTATRREFVTALKAELPKALAHLQRGNIAPVDLAQAAIGPGMAVYTRYSKVLDAEGKPLSVREALTLINQTLDEALAEQEGDFDADSRWALAWFEHAGFAEGEYGVAETLSKAKNTSAAGLVEAGFLASSRGKVRLLRPDELPADWDPTTDRRLTAWETVHQLIRVLEAGGEGAAAFLVAKLGSKAETQ
jgi:predicted nuclease of restriction endonuclease-like (RecB) superfamily